MQLFSAYILQNMTSQSIKYFTCCFAAVILSCSQAEKTGFEGMNCLKNYILNMSYKELQSAVTPYFFIFPYKMKWEPASSGW